MIMHQLMVKGHYQEKSGYTSTYSYIDKVTIKLEIRTTNTEKQNSIRLSFLALYAHFSLANQRSLKKCSKIARPAGSTVGNSSTVCDFHTVCVPVVKMNFQKS
jgi:hypothetical protein